MLSLNISASDFINCIIPRAATKANLVRRVLLKALFMIIYENFIKKVSHAILLLCIILSHAYVKNIDIHVHVQNIYPMHLNDASNYVFPDVIKSEIVDTMTCTRQLRHGVSLTFNVFVHLCVIRLKEKGSEKFSFTSLGSV